jgi:uncharacterized lipoprotein YajG
MDTKDRKTSRLMMKKSILFVLLAAYAAVLFAGCTSDSEIENTDGPPQLPEDITDAELDALFDSRLSRRRDCCAYVIAATRTRS